MRDYSRPTRSGADFVHCADCGTLAGLCAGLRPAGPMLLEQCHSPAPPRFFDQP